MATAQSQLQAVERQQAPTEEASLATAIASGSAWLTLVDQGKFGESWDVAAEIFRIGVPREKWIDAVGAVRGPFGKLVSRKSKATEAKSALPGAPDGQYVVMQFDSSFEKKQVAVETLTVRQEADGAWKAAGYFVK